LAHVLPFAVLGAAAFRCACFSLPGAGQQRSISARRWLYHEQAWVRRDPESIEGQPQLNMPVVAVEVGLGVCLLLWSSSAMRAGTRARTSGVCRRVSLSDAPAAVATPAAETAGPGPSAAVEAAAPLDLSLQPGVCAPYGEPGVSYWDPLGLATDIDAANYRYYRQAELKHGRVCMLAMLGLFVQHSARVPGLEAVVPNGFGAAELGTPSSPCLGLAVMLAGFLEFNLNDEGREPGDFGDPADLAHSSGYYVGPHNPRDWQNFEINHGRLAMFGVIGTLVAEYATGLDGVEQWQRLGAAKARTVAVLFPEGPVPPLSMF